MKYLFFFCGQETINYINDEESLQGVDQPSTEKAK